MFVKDINKSQNLSTSSKAKKSSSGGNFASYLSTSGEIKSSSVSLMSSLAFGDSILSAQCAEQEEKKAKQKQLIKRAQSLISKLEEIRDGLLMGYMSRDMLIGVSRFMKTQKIDIDDTSLLELVGEIELRVEVELAKLMR